MLREHSPQGEPLPALHVGNLGIQGERSPRQGCLVGWAERSEPTMTTNTAHPGGARCGLGPPYISGPRPDRQNALLPRTGPIVTSQAACDNLSHKQQPPGGGRANT